MPAVSKAQARFLNAHFGHTWTRAHHFNNPTAGLPQHVARKKPRKKVRY